MPWISKNSDTGRDTDAGNSCFLVGHDDLDDDDDDDIDGDDGDGDDDDIDGEDGDGGDDDIDGEDCTIICWVISQPTRWSGKDYSVQWKWIRLFLLASDGNLWSVLPLCYPPKLHTYFIPIINDSACLIG